MEDPRFSVGEDGTLKITPMLDSDLGTYECMAKSPVGEAKSRSAKMIYNKRSSKLCIHINILRKLISISLMIYNLTSFLLFVSTVCF